MANLNSLHSPKSPIWGQIHFAKPTSQMIGSCSFTAQTVEAAEQLLKDCFDKHFGKGGDAYVIIRRNRKTYPEFDWEIVTEYTLEVPSHVKEANKNIKLAAWGGARPGAGRPGAGENKRVNLGLRVTPNVKAKVDELRKEGFNVSAAFEQFITEL